MVGFQHIGSFGSKIADLCNFMAPFQPLSKAAMKLPTLAVSWQFEIMPLNMDRSKGCEAAGKLGPLVAISRFSGSVVLHAAVRDLAGGEGLQAVS